MTDDKAEIIQSLFEVLKSRKEELPEDSYTTTLLTHEKGENIILEKLGEEMTELLLAAKDDDLDEITHESADIIYHLLVLFVHYDMELDDLFEELRSRRN